MERPVAAATLPGLKVLAVGFTKARRRLVVVTENGVARSYDVP
jgi:hypothetical protein